MWPPKKSLVPQCFPTHRVSTYFACTDNVKTFHLERKLLPKSKIWFKREGKEHQVHVNLPGAYNLNVFFFFQLKVSNPFLCLWKSDLEHEKEICFLFKNWLIGKDPDAGKDWRQEEKGTTEAEMVGWHHCLDGHEFEQALGIGDGQGSLPWPLLSPPWVLWCLCVPPSVSRPVCPSVPLSAPFPCGINPRCAGGTWKKGSASGIPHPHPSPRAHPHAAAFSSRK